MNIKLESNVVLQRKEFNTDELWELYHGSTFDLEPSKIVELEVNGLVIAKGKIVKRRGEYYFKILEMDREG